MRYLVANRIRTPDGTILQSFSGHHFNSYTDKNGKYFAVDGGLNYTRRLFDVPEYQELSVYDDDPHVLQRATFHWGTYGINGDQPLRRVALKDMDTNHIEAVLETQQKLPPHIAVLMCNELYYRSLSEQERYEWNREECVACKDPNIKYEAWKLTNAA